MWCHNAKTKYPKNHPCADESHVPVAIGKTVSQKDDPDFLARSTPAYVALAEEQHSNPG